MADSPQPKKADSPELSGLRERKSILEQKQKDLSGRNDREEHAKGHDLRAAKLRVEGQLDEVNAAIRKLEGGK